MLTRVLMGVNSSPRSGLVQRPGSGRPGQRGSTANSDAIPALPVAGLLRQGLLMFREQQQPQAAQSDQNKDHQHPVEIYVPNQATMGSIGKALEIGEEQPNPGQIECHRCHRRSRNECYAQCSLNANFHTLVMLNDQLTDGGPSVTPELATGSAGPLIGESLGWALLSSVFVLTTTVPAMKSCKARRFSFVSMGQHLRHKPQG